jgi:nitrogen-specific signal transduction histidine kinase
LGLRASIRDITERKMMELERGKLERQMQQTQKLESLGVLAGGIAHDFNNILMAILGHAELTQYTLSPMSPARENINQIITASHRAAELCQQMLAYSGKASLSNMHINLGELVNEMVHLLKTSISKKALLNLHIEKDTPMIEGDPSQIRQVVMNLIINASDAIGELSGVISVSVGATRCDDYYLKTTELFDNLSPGLYTHIEVSDTGCGMDAETQARIFEPFFTTKFLGRGLGLAAVVGIVRTHNGAIKVYSEQGKGTTFKLLFPSLPSNYSNNEDTNGATANTKWTGQGTILLADDEESIRAVAASMLELIGYKVLTAVDGREAIDIYNEKKNEIDIVVLDMTMPHVDGGEAFKEIRRINPDAKVLIASGYSKEDIGARFAGKGVTEVLQKPYTMKSLRESLKNIDVK